MNRNPLIATHKETIKSEFALSVSTLLKRKVNWDNNSKSKKRQTHEEREAVRAKSLAEFKPPPLVVPTAKEENEMFASQESNM